MTDTPTPDPAAVLARHVSDAWCSPPACAYCQNTWPCDAVKMARVLLHAQHDLQDEQTRAAMLTDETARLREFIRAVRAHGYDAAIEVLGDTDA